MILFFLWFIDDIMLELDHTVAVLRRVGAHVD
jgi:hypothetical protein